MKLLQETFLILLIGGIFGLAFAAGLKIDEQVEKEKMESFQDSLTGE